MSLYAFEIELKISLSFHGKATIKFETYLMSSNFCPFSASESHTRDFRLRGGGGGERSLSGERGLQTRPWISSTGWLGHKRYHGCLPGRRGGGGGGGGVNLVPRAFPFFVGVTHEEGKSPGNVVGGGVLQKRPCVSIGGGRGYIRNHGSLSAVGVIRQ